MISSTSLHLCAVTADGRLWHALRRTASDPSGGEWTDIGDVRQQAGNHGDVIDVSCARTGGDTLRVCAVTGDGHIWHTRRYPDAWTPFDDIEFFRFPGGQVGRDIGTLHSAALGIVSDGASDVCAITTNGRLWHTRIGGNGIPQHGFRNVQTELGVGSFGTVRSVSVC